MHKVVCGTATSGAIPQKVGSRALRQDVCAHSHLGVGTNPIEAMAVENLTPLPRIQSSLFSPSEPFSLEVGPSRTRSSQQEGMHSHRSQTRWNELLPLLKTYFPQRLEPLA